MSENLSDSAWEAMSLATTESQHFNQFYLGTEHLFIGLCKTRDESLKEGFARASFDPSYWRKKVRAAIRSVGSSLAGGEVVPTPRCEKTLKIAERISRRERCEQIEPRHLFLAILVEGEGIPVRMMKSEGFEVEKLALALSGDFLEEEIEHPDAHRFPLLLSLGRELTHLARSGKLSPTLGREREMLSIAQSLRRKNRGSVLIVGDAGIGKSALVYGFAQKIVAPDANAAIKEIRLFEISISSLLAGTRFRGEFEDRMNDLLREASDPNVVLFFDEFHLIKGAGASGESADLANLLKPSLANGELRCIGATTTEEFRRHIEREEALIRRFEVLTLKEPTALETRAILEGIRPSFERHHSLEISDEALEATVSLSEKYLTERKFPDKAVDLLDKACANAVLGSMKERDSFEPETILTREGVAHALKQQVDIALPDDFLEAGNRDLLLNLADRLKASVIGQDEAIETVVRSLQVHFAGLSSGEKPIGSFLFVGPTGVGKTELARALATSFFGSERKLLRFDMSEYSEAHSISRLIGSPPGYVRSEEEGQLSKAVRTTPNAVVLFDEIEKAHPDVLKIFLQILEPGRFTDNHGVQVSFQRAVVIFTSNIGSGLFTEAKRIGLPGRQAMTQKVSPKVIAEVNKTLSPELRNRLDAILVFNPLEDQSLLRKVGEKLLDEIRRLLSDRDIRLTVDAEALDFVLAQGYSIEYGARHLKRTMDRLIREPLALQLHTGFFQPGDGVSVVMKGEAPDREIALEKD